MNDIADVDVYFKRLYSKTNNPPPISVDEFLDIMTRCKDSQIQREKVKINRKDFDHFFVLSFRMFFIMESEISLKNINSMHNIPNENYI